MAGLMDLFIKIGVQDEASGKIKSITQSIGGGLVKAAKVGAVAFAAVGAGAAALSTALAKNVSELATYGDAIDKNSQKMGISAQAYQEWDAILQHNGSSIDSMQRGMMSLASAAEKGKDAFEKIGISEEQVASLSQEELFAEVISGLQGMEAGSERTVLAQQLLGASAKELGPLLNMSAEETEEMRQRVHDLGGVMSDEAVKASAKFTDSLQDMKTAFGGLKNNLLKQFLPSMTKVMDGLTMLFSGDKDGGIAAISEGIMETASQISEVVPVIVDVLTQNAPALISAAIEIAGAVIKSLAEALPGLLSQIWEAVDTAISESSFGERWKSIKEAVSEAVDGIKEKWGELTTKLQPVIDKVQEAWDKFKAWEEENGILEAAIGLVGDAISGVIGFISDLISLGSEAWDGIKSAATAAADAIAGAWQKVADTINNVLGLIGEGVEANFEGYKSGIYADPSYWNSNFAIGNDYVPYNGMPAILHRGEAVLTAREADEWRRGTGRGNTNNFNFSGVSQADLDYIVAYVNRGLA